MIDIFGTLGPSCHDTETLKAMFRYGMRGVRLNLSHVDLADCQEWIHNLHQACQDPLFVIDMQGPELRIKDITEQVLVSNSILDLDTIGLPDVVSKAIQNGTKIQIDDGKIVLEAISFTQAKVLVGGMLKPKKNIVLPDVKIELPILTKRDIKNLKRAKEFGVTGILQPYVQNKEQLIQLKEALNKLHLDLKIYAKIENQEGVDHLESLFPYCDEIVIARGDLGTNVGLIQLPSIQHFIETKCRDHNMPYMVVTEMLSSMIDHPTPTRAEVNDIYQAVFQGAHSIMLTGETAAGNYPKEAMRIFCEVSKCAIKDSYN